MPLVGVGPEDLLRLLPDGRRGFWARGRRWVAHGGVVAELRVRSGGPGRFDLIRKAASEVVAAGLAGADERPDRLRFYGGFSFRADHRAVDRWAAFPSGLFHLPRVELRDDGADGARLRVRAPVPAGAGGWTDGDGGLRDELMEGLRDEAEALAQGLREMAGAVGGSEAAPPHPSGGVVATDRQAWLRAVEETLDAIRAGRIEKAVLARTLDVDAGPAPDPVAVALALWRQNRGTHAYLFEPQPGRVLVGAAPETIATLRDGIFHATAVAGSIRHGESEEERRRLARHLLESRKDRAEQRVVVEDMVRRLEPLAEEVRVQDEPHVLALARIQHLETVLRARVPGRHVLELVEALHPTPAVCGLPRDEALAFLREEEPFERGWYAGPVGWFDSGGNGAFVPALRCGVLQRGTWRLFAGAGIVAGSDPVSEWEETGIKFEPMLQALDGAGAGDASASAGTSEEGAHGGPPANETGDAAVSGAPPREP